MEEVVRRDLLHILSAALSAVRSEDSAKLRELSNHTIHDASIYQDQDSIVTAVIIYSISKLLGRQKLNRRKFERLLEAALEALQGPSINAYRGRIDRILEAVADADGQLKAYMDSVITHAQLKKGTKLHDHGISVGKASEMLGVSQWDMMSYLGKTALSETWASKIEAKKRLLIARRMFNL